MNKWHAIQLGRYAQKERIKSMRIGVVHEGGGTLDCHQSDIATLEALISSHDVRFTYTSGMHWPERSAREYLKSKGIPLVVLDLGYFKRAKDSKDREGYNQVGLDRIGWTPNSDIDSSRWDAFGFADCVDPVIGRPKSVLILGQVPNDSQHGMNEKQLNRWFDEKSRPFRDAGMPITFRPHPCNPNGKPPACDAISSQSTLKEELCDHSHVITFNSTAGLDAILAGIPVLCDASAHYYDIAGYGNSAVRTQHAQQRIKAQVMHHMHRLAWSQWTCAEIESGEPIRFLFPKLIQKPMNHLIAIPYFGSNPKYLEMLHEWVRVLKRTAPDARFLVFTHDAEEALKPFGYPTLTLSIDGYADVIREGQPFDIKGALMCEAAMNIRDPFLMLDADALLVANPSEILDAMNPETVCAMPIDHGAILHGHKSLCEKPFADVRKMCAGVFWFGDVSRRAELVTSYRLAWREMFSHDCPWLPCLPHLLEQYAWSLAHHRLSGETLPATLNWAPHILGESPHAIVNHYFGHKKWNGQAPKNT